MGILTLLSTFAPSLIQLAEKAITKDKGGPDKFSLVQKALKTMAEEIGKATGQGTPDDKALAGMVEGLVQDMKARGALTTGEAAPAEIQVYALAGNRLQRVRLEDVTR